MTSGQRRTKGARSSERRKTVTAASASIMWMMRRRCVKACSRNGGSEPGVPGDYWEGGL